MKNLFLFIIACAIIMPMVSMAQEETPPMGPPEEMKNLEFLVGDWEAEMEFLMDTTQGWVKSTGTCTYSYILDGAALKMGMPFKGLSFETYDRENKQWQSVWVDNMGARTTMMTGVRENNGSVFENKDKYKGVVMMNRMTTSNETKTSFDWLMESSMDDGKTWFENGRAKYTKKK